MKFILIEGDTLINLDLVEKVELRLGGTAILWAGGIHLCESPIAYQFFKRHAKDPEVIIQPEE